MNKKEKFMLVGGTFHEKLEKVKFSSIVDKLGKNLINIYKDSIYYILNSYVYNNKEYNPLISAARISKYYDLNIWMPDISNDFEKHYPTKAKGNVLICSKVIRDGRTVHDAVNRIFKMHANAVIAISRDTSDSFQSSVTYKFTLLDALGNVWVETTDIKKLAQIIYKFYKWTKQAQRVGSISVPKEYKLKDNEKQRLKKFCKLNSKVANKVEMGNEHRYFGNCSTRCSLMFPSTRSTNPNYIFVSRRDSNKKRLTMSDMLVVTMHSDSSRVVYQGNIKPSVDTPIQLQLYKKFPEINYMIHGHAYETTSNFTDKYFACGDIREVESIAKHIKNVDVGCINLLNHGFILYSKTLEDMEIAVNNLYFFMNKRVGVEFI